MAILKMKINVLLCLILVLGTSIFSGCIMSKLYITGAEEAIGAKVIIDGKEMGIMKKGPKFGAILILNISSGEHDIVIISKDGKKITKNFTIKGENYLGVDFANMTIRN